jgi:hypothetical protein
LPALAVAVYKGVLFSTSSQPGWKDARWLGAYLTNSTIVLGCGELLVLSIVMGQEGAVMALRPALALLLVLNFVTTILLFIDVHGALAQTRTRRELFWLSVLVVGPGLALPLCLMAVTSSWISVVAVMSLALGAVVVRHEIVLLPHRQVD